MKVVTSRYSYASCGNIEDALDAMFPEKIPDNFTMSSPKVYHVCFPKQLEPTLSKLWPMMLKTQGHLLPDSMMK